MLRAATTRGLAPRVGTRWNGVRRTSQDGESRLVTGVAESNPGSRSEGEGGDLGGGDVESDGHGEEDAVGETKGLNDAVGEAR